MASVPSMANTSKMSFAKIAAIAGKENVALGPSTRASASTSRDTTESAQHTARQPSSTTDNTTTNTSTSVVANTPTPTEPASNAEGSDSSLVEAVKALQVHDSTPSLVVNGSGVVGDSGPGTVAEEMPENSFSRVDSSSESGTKPPSLDGKSITSGTTFALDERESLRPDDSASVKAAEDDDTFSGRGSIIAGSRIGSETGTRYRNNQFYEPSDRRNTLTGPDPQLVGIRTPHSGSSEQQTVDETKTQGLLAQMGEPVAHSLFYKQGPDEKLLEALDSPKDRIFLLLLEKEVMEFVKDSKEPYIDLPPCNSFCRMLTHKLADYYHLTHQVDPHAGAVRIYRTPFCRIPQSLSTLSTPPTTGSTPPPPMPTMKIMRRGEDNGTMSKATSENDSDGKEKSSSAKDKAQLTREEREAQYALARERIFGKDSEKTGEATPDTEKSDNDMSRSSSVSNKDRSGKRGRKQRREDSESFDARSSYTAYYPTQTQQPAWTPKPIMANNMNMGVARNGAPMPNTYQNAPYPQMAQQYQNPMMGGGAMQYNQMGQQYPQQQAMHQSMQPQYQGSPMQNYAQPMPSMPQGPQPPPPWQQNMYPNTYQSPPPPYTQQHSRGPGSIGPPIPYPYGQLPSTANPADPKSQHPIPGSFNRSAFNPKTQSFIPGSGGRPGQQQMMPQQAMHQQPMYPQQMFQQTLSQHGSPRLGYNNGYALPNQQYNGGNMGYGMARQGSNNSVPSYHASPQIPNRPMVQQNMHQNHPANLPPNPALAHHMPPNGHNGSHLPQYGNASTLPPKPPPAMQ